MIGLHRERYDSPLFETLNSEGTVVFNSALPLIHTGALPKKVYASYSTPIFTEVSQGTDYVPSSNSYSLSSTAIYGGTIGASSKTLGQGSFTAFLKDGITDPLAKLEGENLWFRFYPDKYKAPYLLDQGKLGLTMSYPSSDNISAACTINAETAATKVES